MNTLMTEQTFIQLMNLRDELRSSFRPNDQIAGVFAPWAGSRLKEEGGIYYVGAATHRAFWLEEERPANLEQCLRAFTKRDFNASPNKPFWLFLNALTTKLCKAEVNDCAENIGWSNLIKIGYSEDTPDKLPKLVAKQRKLCIRSLREEIADLHNSVVVFASNDPYERILYEVTGTRGESDWENAGDDTGVYWFDPKERSNFYVWGYHPRHAQMKNKSCNLWDNQLAAIVRLIGNRLSPS